MQVNIADLRSMMRDDAVGLLLGAILLLTGLVTATLVSLLRRRASILIWLGVFSFLYGLRLLIRTGIVRFYFDLPTVVWERAESAITYTVPIPFALFARAAFPTWRRFWTIGGSGLTAFALYAVASDAILHQPHSADRANSIIAVAFFIGVVAWAFLYTLAPSRELHTLRAGVVAVAVTAIADNLRGLRVVAFPGPELEPFGFTVLIACLGTIAVWRVLADAERLIALNSELEIARRIQSSILPQAMPRIAGLHVVARYRPMTAVAGDFYDFVEIDSQRVGILVADVSGHGVPAALIASMVKVAFAAQRQHAESPAAVLAGMNETLCGRLAGQYVTAAYLFIDSQSQVIRYGAAGHPPMLRAIRGAGSVDEIAENGLILGFVNGRAYTEVEESLGSGTRFLLYTDGLIEATNVDDDFFGIERLESALVAADGLPASAAADNVLTTIDTWSRRRPSDDLTLVLVDWIS